MKPFAWRWLAAGSLIIGTVAAPAETRPQYGGVLHITMRAAPASLDPADSGAGDSFADRSMDLLVFDTLVTLDESGRPKPALAESWQGARGNQRWQFRLRRDVKFHDGTPLTAEIAAASLRKANPSWNVKVESGALMVECDPPEREFLAEVALPRNAIAKRDDRDNLSGTGPFRIVDWQPGKKLSLAADEDHWRGRPFLDGVEIEMGRSLRDQMTALELGKAELVEMAPEQAHRVSPESRRVAVSPPIELLALVFTRDLSFPGEQSLREALALSVERGSIRSVLLQGTGQPTASLLPTWMSGYGFLFASDADLPKAQQLREGAHKNANWTIGYDSADPLARLIAERVALNAHDAGLTLQPTTSTNCDLRLTRIPMPSANPWVSLGDVAVHAGLPALKTKGGSAEDLYAAESALLATDRVIPLFHLSATYLSTSGLHNWRLRLDGGWDISETWLENAKP